jgi:hypothetical protein
LETFRDFPLFYDRLHPADLAAHQHEVGAERLTTYRREYIEMVIFVNLCTLKLSI